MNEKKQQVTRREVHREVAYMVRDDLENSEFEGKSAECELGAIRALIESLLPLLQYGRRYELEIRKIETADQVPNFAENEAGEVEVFADDNVARLTPVIRSTIDVVFEEVGCNRKLVKSEFGGARYPEGFTVLNAGESWPTAGGDGK